MPVKDASFRRQTRVTAAVHKDKRDICSPEIYESIRISPKNGASYLNPLPFGVAGIIWTKIQDETTGGLVPFAGD